MFALVVVHRLAPGARAAFDDLVAGALPVIRANEPGTLAYVVHDQVDEPDVVVFYELYRDRAAFAEHEQQPHVKAFLAAREPLLASRPEVLFLDSTGSARPWDGR